MNNQPNLFNTFGGVPEPSDPPPSTTTGDTPKNDSAPTGIGARVNSQNILNQHTRDRLPVQGKARKNGPWTSKAAAKAAGPRIPSQRDRVLGYIVACGDAGATDAEIEAATRIKCNIVPARRGELAEAGLIRLTGAYRLTPSGNPAQVWAATDSGKSVAASITPEAGGGA